DRNVTGVQTCALPISRQNEDILNEFKEQIIQDGEEKGLTDDDIKRIIIPKKETPIEIFGLLKQFSPETYGDGTTFKFIFTGTSRSEERRVGKVDRQGW